jgi:hypothetical protein
VQRIPDSLVVRRWTKNARIQLPGYMSVYSRADPALKAQTYRHASLMISVLEFMELADRNVETYKIGLQHCHTRFPEGNQMHLICVPGSSSTHMIDEMSVIS